jgi:choline dehydrogenase-like flavoprotein
MVYNRGSADDWDRYAQFTGDPGWSWESIQPYIAKVSAIGYYLSHLLINLLRR